MIFLVRILIAVTITLFVSAVANAQASKKLSEVTKRMESPQQKMDHADKIMREQDKMSSKRGIIDKRKNPNERPGVKRMILPRKK